MKFSQISQLFIFALAASPSLACVNFSASFSPLNGPAPCINAALTDPGLQVCTYNLCDIYNHGIFVRDSKNGYPANDVVMNCIGGYSASLNWKTRWVKYDTTAGNGYYGGFYTDAPFKDARG